MNKKLLDNYDKMVVKDSVAEDTLMNTIKFEKVQNGIR